MSGLLVLGLASGLLAGAGALEYSLHRRRLRQIPVRIHVSGTRGKSSVTRLLAAGLRKAGRRTCAKTTGTLPRMILPDAEEIPVFRPQGANIIEQTRIVSLATALEAEAFVVECMALKPELHWLSEDKLVRATHGVITNCRADHLDVMGPTEQDVARAMAGMIPIDGTLFTAEKRHLAILEAAARDRGTKLVAVTDEDRAAVSPADLARFSYTEHVDNVALSLKVLASLGVSREVALEGMWRAKPDPGALTEHRLNFFGRRIMFINGFAANDPESSAQVWEMAKARHPDISHRIVVFNLRVDRVSRTTQLARDVSFWHDADAVVLMGTGSYQFARVALRDTNQRHRFVYADAARIEDTFEQILGACGKNSLVVGLGNIGGQGLALIRYFRNRSSMEVAL